MSYACIRDRCRFPPLYHFSPLFYLSSLQAVVLALTITSSTIPPESSTGIRWTRLAKTSYSTYIWEQKGEGQGLTGLDVLLGDAAPKPGYKKLPEDLTNGTSQPPVFLAVASEGGKTSPIVDIKLVNEKDRFSSTHYTKVGVSVTPSSQQPKDFLYFQTKEQAKAASKNKYSVGDFLDVLDTEKVWRVSKVLKVDDDKQIFVHYEGWGDRWDEWVPVKGSHERIAPLHTYTKRGQETGWSGNAKGFLLIDRKSEFDELCSLTTPILTRLRDDPTWDLSSAGSDRGDHKSDGKDDSGDLFVCKGGRRRFDAYISEWAKNCANAIVDDPDYISSVAGFFSFYMMFTARAITHDLTPSIPLLEGAEAAMGNTSDRKFFDKYGCSHDGPDPNGKFAARQPAKDTSKPLPSFYIVRNINTFGEHGGFLSLAKMISRFGEVSTSVSFSTSSTSTPGGPPSPAAPMSPTPTTSSSSSLDGARPITVQGLSALLGLFHAGRHFYTEEVWTKYVPMMQLAQGLLARFPTLTEEEMRSLSKDNIAELFALVLKLEQAVAVGEYAHLEAVEPLRLVLAKRLTESRILDRQLLGLDIFGDLIKFAVRSPSTASSSPSPSGAPPVSVLARAGGSGGSQQVIGLSDRYIAKFISEHKLAESLLTSNSHEQVVKRVDPMLVLLAHCDRLTSAHVALLWDCGVGKHESLLRVVLACFERLFPLLSSSTTAQLWRRLREIPSDQVTEFMLVFFRKATLASIRVTLREDPDNQAREWAGMPIFWALLNTNERLDPAVVARVHETVQDLLAQPEFAVLRTDYILETLQQLKAGTRVVARLRALQTLVTVPRNPGATAVLHGALVNNHNIINVILKDLSRYCAKVASLATSFTNPSFSFSSSSSSTSTSSDAAALAKIPVGSTSSTSTLTSPSSPAEAALYAQDSSVLDPSEEWTHEEQLVSRLSFIERVAAIALVLLDADQVASLWSSMTSYPSLSSGRLRLLAWITNGIPPTSSSSSSSSSRSGSAAGVNLFSLEAKTYIFSKVLTDETVSPPEVVTPTSFRCFETMLMRVNTQASPPLLEGEGLPSDRRFVVYDFASLIGLDYLKEVLLRCKDESVAGLATRALVSLVIRQDHRISSTSKRDHYAQTLKWAVDSALQSIPKAAAAADSKSAVDNDAGRVVLRALRLLEHLLASLAANDAIGSPKWCPEDRVLAVWHKNGRAYEATIVGVNTSGLTYRVFFADGDRDDAVPENRIAPSNKYPLQHRAAQLRQQRQQQQSEENNRQNGDDDNSEANVDLVAFTRGYLASDANACKLLVRLASPAQGVSSHAITSAWSILGQIPPNPALVKRIANFYTCARQGAPTSTSSSRSSGRRSPALAASDGSPEGDLDFGTLFPEANPSELLMALRALTRITESRTDPQVQTFAQSFVAYGGMRHMVGLMLAQSIQPMASAPLPVSPDAPEPKSKSLKSLVKKATASTGSASSSASSTPANLPPQYEATSSSALLHDSFAMQALEPLSQLVLDFVKGKFGASQEEALALMDASALLGKCLELVLAFLSLPWDAVVAATHLRTLQVLSTLVNDLFQLTLSTAAVSTVRAFPYWKALLYKGIIDADSVVVRRIISNMLLRLCTDWQAWSASPAPSESSGDREGKSAFIASPVADNDSDSPFAVLLPLLLQDILPLVGTKQSGGQLTEFFVLLSELVRKCSAGAKFLSLEGVATDLARRIIAHPTVEKHGAGIGTVSLKALSEGTSASYGASSTKSSSTTSSASKAKEQVEEVDEGVDGLLCGLLALATEVLRKAPSLKHSFGLTQGVLAHVLGPCLFELSLDGVVEPASLKRQQSLSLNRDPSVSSIAPASPEGSEAPEDEQEAMWSRLVRAHSTSTIVPPELGLTPEDDNVATIKGADAKAGASAAAPAAASAALKTSSSSSSRGGAGKSASGSSSSGLSDADAVAFASKDAVLPPKCKSPQSRRYAFGLVNELVRDNPQCLAIAASLLADIHAMPHSNGEKPEDFDFLNVEMQSKTGYLGLRNLGSTCYINSLVQQMFFIPALRRNLLAIDTEGLANKQSDFLYQLQYIFASLQDSARMYVDPEVFLRTYKPNGQPIALNQQDDSGGFMTTLCDDIHNHPLLKSRRPQPAAAPSMAEAAAEEKKGGASRGDGARGLNDKQDANGSTYGSEDIGGWSSLSSVIGGELVHQLVGKESGCGHVRETIEQFWNITVEIKNKRSVVDGLRAFVAGEMLAGDNAYKCAQCNAKRDTLKRITIKTLPPTVAITLKRFDLDFVTFQTVKLNQRVEIPETLDLKPYTKEGIAETEAASAASAASGAASPTGGDNPSFEGEGKSSQSDSSVSSSSQQQQLLQSSLSSMHPEEYYQYVLRGMVIHTGDANRGHYYSYVQERAEDGEQGRWFEMNDHNVSTWDIANLDRDCFGGTVEVDPELLGPGQHLPPQPKANNAYILFYDRVTPNAVVEKRSEKAQSSVSSDGQKAGGEGISTSASSSAGAGGLDFASAASLVTMLQTKTNRAKEVVHSRVRTPPSLRLMVARQNITFRRDKMVYDKAHFDFLTQLFKDNSYLTRLDESKETSMSTSMPSATAGGSLSEMMVRLSVRFTFQTLCRAKEKDLLGHWLDIVQSFFERRWSAAPMVQEWLLQEVVEQHWVYQLGLLCRDAAVRRLFATIVTQSFLGVHLRKPAHPVLAKVVDAVIDVVPSLPANWKCFNEYFYLADSIAQTGGAALGKFRASGLVSKLADMFLGDESPLLKNHTFPVDEKGKRRRIGDSWTKCEWAPMFKLITSIAAPAESSARDAARQQKQQQDESKGGAFAALNLQSSEVDLLTCSPFLTRMFRTTSTAKDAAAVSALAIALSRDSPERSKKLVGELTREIEEADDALLRGLFRVFSSLCCLEDSLQGARVKMALSGLLSTMEHHQKYWLYTDMCIEQLIRLSKKSLEVQTALLAESKSLVWMLDWLTIWAEMPQQRGRSGVAGSAANVIDLNKKGNSLLWSAEYQAERGSHGGAGVRSPRPHGRSTAAKKECIQLLVDGQRLTDEGDASDSDDDVGGRRFDVGDYVDVLDKLTGVWRVAVVLDVRQSDTVVYTIHYDGFSDKFTDIIDSSERRIAALGKHSSRAKCRSHILKASMSSSV